ncbi:polyprenyl synthetase family protein [Thermomonas carbonis]|uniref:Polyprenyl synthetase family protein n=1 Tax=Thermomonas carbonis TaxID=1463158 RepID=A0A7G9SQL0_9GAMM|nr:farnesyl diphosphate synthase [Thermomonas carbonis]QNN70135.1 polyprenyl synthetase family protein [Thermomonas carbonis]GHB97991.1 farnesyl-diphosphate synthase [Thermomonas carbonis]
MPDAAFAAWRARVEVALDLALPDPATSPERLYAAMRHGVLNGGKRMRPLLVFATGTAFDADEAALDDAAVAVELIHCYSLVHDDLPAMDDDVLRRGQPTVHVAFDEATAILAGDALQALAFQALADAPLAADRRVGMLAELARAAGVAGMCGGQALDIDATGKWGQSGLSQEKGHSDPTFLLADLERLHALKTGALLRASVRLGVIAAGADAASRDALDRYADALGLAFQIRDDLLDVEGDAATLGKTAGKDAAQDKATFPALLGIDASRARLASLADTMQQALSTLDVDTTALAALARLVVERDR